MIIRDFIDDIARSVAFLSRVHMPERHFIGHDGKLNRAVQAFAVAGALIALPGAAVFSVLDAFRADAWLSALLALAVYTAITGVLHEDGLCDTADGLGGGKTPEQAMTIMRDSRIGTYGGVALFFTFALRASAMAVLFRTLSPSASGCVLVATAALSRACLVWHWRLLPPARKDGVASRVGEPDPQSALIAFVSAGLLVAVLMVPHSGLWNSAIAVAMAIAATYIFSRFALHKIGGNTGDTLGASQQISEIAVLCTLALIAGMTI
jgi:adenosylcobinamide-GDP ribazoletransferase